MKVNVELDRDMIFKFMHNTIVQAIHPSDEHIRALFSSAMDIARAVAEFAGPTIGGHCDEENQVDLDAAVEDIIKQSMN